MAKKTEEEKGPSKMGLVREALASLGESAKTQDLHEHILSTSGIDIPNNVISTYRSMLKSKGTSRKSSRNSSSAVAEDVGESIKAYTLNDLQAVRKLIDRVGATELTHLIKMLSK
jgi:hypothetical protein